MSRPIGKKHLIDMKLITFNKKRKMIRKLVGYMYGCEADIICELKGRFGI